MAINVFLVLPMCLSAFFITYWLINLRKSNRAQKSLIWLYVTTFILFLGRNAMMGGFFSPTIDIIVTISLLFVYPSAYRTIVMICRGKLKPWQNLFVFAPALLFGVVETAQYIYMGSAETEEIIKLYSSQTANVTTTVGQSIVAIHDTATIIFIVLVVATLALSTYEIVRSDRQLLHYYSNLKNRSLKPLGILLYISVFTSVAARVTESIANKTGTDVYWILSISSVILSVSLALVGYVVRNQKFFADKQKQTFNRCEKNAFDDSSEKNRERIRKTLNSMVSTQQLYIDPDLSIDQMADKLKVSSTWLANFTETTFGMTFFHCINRHRITRAQMLLSAPKNKKRSEVIDEAWRGSGFTSRREMNAMFKAFHMPEPR